MVKFVGTASVEDMAGNVVAALVNISLNDDPNECPYKTPAPWYGDIWRLYAFEWGVDLGVAELRIHQ